MSMDLARARRVVSDLFDIMEQRDLPLPYSVGLDSDVVDVTWMLQENLEASRAVLNAFPGDWTVHVVSRVSEPVLEYASPTLAATVYAHPDSINLRPEIT